MDKYTTEILNRLEQIERLIKDMKKEEITLQLFPLIKRENVNSCTVTDIGVASCCPVEFKNTDVVYKNILSLLKAEQYKLKQELKDSLDIGENTHYDYEE